MSFLFPEESDKPPVLLDLDGVLADWVGSAGALFNRPNLTLEWPVGKEDRLYEVLGYPEKTVYQAIVSAGPTWWENLPELPWAAYLLARLRGKVELMICTSMAGYPEAAAGKLNWLRKRKFQNHDVILTSRKHLLARSGAVLVDDTERTVEKYRKAGGGALLFPAPWNRLHTIQRGAEMSLWIDTLIAFLTGESKLPPVQPGDQYGRYAEATPPVH